MHDRFNDTMHAILTCLPQKSHKKNLELEEQWRRNEANMRRKQAINAQLANNAGSPNDAPLSPASTGAMDDLLQKLRAAGPQTRATREQRRRARLKDRHLVRVASGQKMPETGENVNETSSLTTIKTGGSEDAGATEGGVSESEDVADRAASLLQGLRGDGEGLSDAPNRDESLRVRRRRESADDERARRRARRRAAGTNSESAGQRMIAEEMKAPTEEEIEEKRKRSSGQELEQLPTPTTIIVPPSPTPSENGDQGD